MIDSPSPRFEPRQRSWQIDRVLLLDYELSPAIASTIKPSLKAEFAQLLARDVYSEGDSRPLFEHLLSRKPEFSGAFWSMIEKWFADEQQHYEALRRVYRLVAGVSFREMDFVFAQRTPEIAPIRAILVDEFTILVSFLFDELGSMVSYRRDLGEYYQHYGPAIARVGKNVMMDEGIHFDNALTLLKHNHSRRLGEISALLEDIAHLESGLERYHQSFFLDHAQERFRFPPQFNQVIIQMILARLELAAFPRHVKILWSWPESGKNINEKLGVVGPAFVDAPVSAVGD